MAIFLNKSGIVKHFKRLFEEAKSEIVMVVPYIKTNNEIINQFTAAEKKGIEILVVYREAQVNSDELKILSNFKNVTLLHHPNVHAKCYMNDSSMIICSMNLYDHSIKNNREMGILLDLFPDEINEKYWTDEDTNTIEDAISEIQSIVNSASVVAKSKYITQNGFAFRTLLLQKQRISELVLELNKHCDNKSFEVIEDKYANLSIVSKDYFENVDLYIDIDEFNHSRKELKELNIRRFEIYLKQPENQLSLIEKQFNNNINNAKLEFHYKQFKVYWSKKRSIFVYRDQHNYKIIWDDSTETEDFKNLLKGCNAIINDLRKIPAFNKIY